MSPEPSLEVELLPGFNLSNPLMIASSHLTSNKPAFTYLSRIRPSAVTLKTTSTAVGGAGKGGRLMVDVVDFEREVIGIYTDGPKDLEFLDLDATRLLLTTAREILPQSLLGLSVLQDPREYYPALAHAITGYDYVEFNLKYSLRSGSISHEYFADTFALKWKELVREIQKFLVAFKEKPIFIKLPRELAPLIPSREWSEVWEILRQANFDGARVGLVAANSLRCRIPPMFHNQSIRRKIFSELSEGVLTGPALFFNTYDLIRQICTPAHGWQAVPVVASGGIVTVQSILDVLSAGASAVQLCSALDIHQVEYYTWLLNQLTELRRRCHVISFSKMLNSFHFEKDFRVSSFKESVADLARSYPDHVRKVFEDSRDKIRELVTKGIRESSKLTPANLPQIPLNVRNAENFELNLFSRDGSGADEPLTVQPRVWSNTGHLTVHAVLTKFAKARNKVFPTSTDVVGAFKGETPWDITAISYAHTLTVEAAESKYEPVFLGFLCDDPFKIVAPHGEMERISTLYQFGGLSSQQVGKVAMARYPHLKAQPLNPTALSYLLFLVAR